MPPMPMMGMVTACARFVDHAQGDGLDGRAGEAAGDVGEARLAGFGSMDMARKVLVRLTASAPAFGGDLGHVGDGSDVGRELDDERTAARRILARLTRYSSEPGSEPKAMPPAWTLGQETLSS